MSTADTLVLEQGLEPRYVPDYRLTRRGRLVVLVVGLFLALAVGVVFASGSVATDRNEETRVHVVQPGDTLWDISAELAAETGQGDTRDMMRHVQDLNDLDGVTLDAGQRLVVPVG
jgi:hypothetical protein